ncbi:hypothetical protein D9600_04170 [Deinococcus sp. DB0503]|nr:hypothetical protein [Deinococcus sp. DB0503]
MLTPNRWCPVHTNGKRKVCLNRSSWKAEDEVEVSEGSADASRSGTGLPDFPDLRGKEARR